MYVELGANESLRVQVYQDIFVDTKRGNNGESLETSFYEMHFHQLRYKSREFRMFSFYDKEDIASYNFGWYSDAKIVWKSY